ncbi:MAG: hypothetical protein HY606_05885 [Planctomycetes bacterium]|nr:hypothetical protein [Planctomycetota bacterium]
MLFLSKLTGLLVILALVVPITSAQQGLPAPATPGTFATSINVNNLTTTEGGITAISISWTFQDGQYCTSTIPVNLPEDCDPDDWKLLAYGACNANGYATILGTCDGTRIKWIVPMPNSQGIQID